LKAVKKNALDGDETRRSFGRSFSKFNKFAQNMINARKLA